LRLTGVLEVQARESDAMQSDFTLVLVSNVLSHVLLFLFAVSQSAHRRAVIYLSGVKSSILVAAIILI
jgi:hypothetical protein